MTEFVVRVARLVTAEFTIEATDEADAQARYREDGEETASRIDKQVVFKVLTREEWEQDAASKKTRS